MDFHEQIKVNVLYSEIVYIWKDASTDGYMSYNCGWTASGTAYLAAASGARNCGTPPSLFEALCLREPGWFYLYYVQNLHIYDHKYFKCITIDTLNG